MIITVVLKPFFYDITFYKNKYINNDKLNTKIIIKQKAYAFKVFCIQAVFNLETHNCFFKTMFIHNCWVNMESFVQMLLLICGMNDFVT